MTCRSGVELVFPRRAPPVRCPPRRTRVDRTESWRRQTRPGQEAPTSSTREAECPAKSSVSRLRLPDTNAEERWFTPTAPLCPGSVLGNYLSEGIGIDGERSRRYWAILETWRPLFDPAFARSICFGRGSSGSVRHRARGACKFCLDRPKPGGLIFVRRVFETFQPFRNCFTFRGLL